MKQHDAINIILGELVNRNMIVASFLTGTIVSSPNLEAAVDFHLVINKDYLQEFKINYLKIFETYHEILFSKEEDNKIICVFEDDVFINFEYHLEDNLIIDTDFLGIYDPHNILNERRINNQVTSSELGSMINNFIIELNTFYFYYLNNKNISAFESSLNVYRIYSMILRVTSSDLFDLEQLAKNSKYLEVMKVLNLNKYLIAVYTMTIDINSLIGNLPISVAQKINYDYFLRVKKLIFSLIEE